MTLGERLKRYRELAGLSQGELARRAGVSRPIISNVEAGKHRGIHTENARKIARALHITLDQLVGEGETVAASTAGADA